MAKIFKEINKKKENGLIKVITGIRRCGKSYLGNKRYYVQSALDLDTREKTL